jgi:flagellar hook-basal body complex protein FliE
MAVLPVGAVGSIGATPFVAPSLGGAPATSPAFGEMLANGLKSVEGAQETASSLSAQVATGSLTDIHEFTTAAAKASLGVQLTATLRNRAIEAYQEIMRMQL